MLIDKARELFQEIQNSNLSDANLQRIMAPKLRQIATQHLLENKFYRECYEASVRFVPIENQAYSGKDLDKDILPFDQYVKNQRGRGVFGTDLTAAALGDLFDISIFVRSNTKSNPSTYSKPYSIHEASDNNRPSITLYNSNNVHWFIDTKVNTRGDGNCLFNAIAQGIRMQYRQKKTAKAQPSSNKIEQVSTPKVELCSTNSRSSTKPIHTQSSKKQSIVPTISVTKKSTQKPVVEKPLINTVNDKKATNKIKIDPVLNLQSRLFKAFSKTASSSNEPVNAPKKILTKAEKAQIKQDYDYAFKLAEEELKLSRQSNSGRFSQ